jgi:hypothetical protein
VAAVAGGDAGGLLTAVLKREQGEVGESRDVVLGGVDAEHTALVAGPVAIQLGFGRSNARSRADWSTVLEGFFHESLAGNPE